MSCVLSNLILTFIRVFLSEPLNNIYVLNFPKDVT